MPNENYFSKFCKPGAVNLERKTTQPFRQTRHSASNWWSSKSKKDITVAAAAQTFTNGASVAGAVAASITVATAAAGTNAVLFGTVGGVVAASLATAVTVIASPFVAMAACLIGLIFLAQSLYSDRESRHNILAKYVYNLIDSSVPSNSYQNNSAENLKEAASAAAYLLMEGPSQLATMHIKLGEKEKEFNALRESYNKITYPFCEGWNAVIQFLDYYKSLTPARRTEANLNELMSRHQILNSSKILAEKLLSKNDKQNGVIFEYMRRLLHAGNYLQAPALLDYSLFKLIGHPIPERGDPFAGWSKAQETRRELAAFSERINQVEKHYEKWEFFAKTHGML